MNFIHIWIGHVGIWFVFFVLFTLLQGIYLRKSAKLPIFDAIILSCLIALFSAAAHVFLRPGN